MGRALSIYRRLARAFPHEFKLVYGAEVEQAGEDVVQEMERKHGIADLARLLVDIAIRVPVEYLSEMRRDLRYAMRGLMKSPGFALVGIISLGLGMGITTSVFGRLWVQMFRGLPGAAHADALAITQAPLSLYYVDQFRTQKDLFAGVAAFEQSVPFNVALSGNESARRQRVFGQIVSTDYFAVLGVIPQRGRVFSSQIDRPGDAPVVVITDSFWRNRLNSAPEAVGQVLRLNGWEATIVGITPEGFNGALPINPSEIFVPVTAPAGLAPELSRDILEKRDAKAFLPLFWLAPGVSPERAESALDALVRRLDAEEPSIAQRNDKGRRVTLLDGGKRMPVPRELKPVVIGFTLVLVGLIMSIACMNLANMLLARSSTRGKELAIRLATGASRFRLIRQMVTEGLLLALLSGAAGFCFAWWFSTLSSKFRPPSVVPLDPGPRLDWHAAIFAFGLAVLCGIGFSLAPALHSTKADVAQTLREGGVTQLRGYRWFGLRNLLVVGQVAGSLMLLLITGFLAIGFSVKSSVQTSFDPNRMLLLAVDPVRDGDSAARAAGLFDALPERMRGIAGVTRVVLADQPPFSIVPASLALTADRGSGRSAPMTITAASTGVGAGYFAALNARIVAGREFDDHDGRASAGSGDATSIPLVLNESAAQALFAGANAVGQRLTSDGHAYEVVGVVRDFANGVVADQDTSNMVYTPLTRRDFTNPPPGGVTIMVRSDGGVDAMRVQRAIAAVDPNLAPFNVETLGEHLALSRAILRLNLQTYAAMGLFGLILAAIGLAGVTAYAVSRRRREIGIRMALGARRAQVLMLVLREGMVLVGSGMVLGFLGAVALVRALSALASIFVDAFQVGTGDPRLIVGAPLLLMAIALLACYLPARSSATINPIESLRRQ